AEAYLGDARHERERARMIMARANEAQPLIASLRRSLNSPVVREPDELRQYSYLALARAEDILNGLPSDRVYRIRLAELSTLAALLSRSPAEDAQAVARWEKLLGELEEHRTRRPGSRSALAALVHFHHNLGRLHLKAGRHEEAIDHYRQALPLWESLVASDDVNVPSWRHWLAYDCTELGGLLRTAGRDAEALPALARA